MQEDRIKALATAIVFGTGCLWGFYWLPVRSLSELGLPGAWGTVAITTAAAAILLPFTISRWRKISSASAIALISVALGGAAFTLYSVGFVYGRVAIIILLYFLTPVWSTLIARYVMGWHTPRLRILAIGVGLAGLVVMLSANGEIPVPRGAGEWMSLIAGMLWSVSTTGIRARPELGPREAAFVFAIGAAVTALFLAPFLETWPSGIVFANLLPTLGLAFATGGFWWVLSVTCLIWAAARLDPTRVGILLMVEVIVGAMSAAVLANEMLDSVEMVGGALVLCAGALEVWPARRTVARQAG